MKTEFCTHQFLRPIAWNQPKPAPHVIMSCDCGGNTCCPICNFGTASDPCNCDGIMKYQKEEPDALSLHRLQGK